MTANATVLTEVPGPRGRARSRLVSVVGGILIAGLLGWVLYRLSAPQVAVNGNETPAILDPVRWEPLTNPQVWLRLAEGAKNTLWVAGVAMVGALCLAVVFALGRLANSALIRIPVTIVLELFRGMPVLLMMLFILLVASTGPFWAVVLALIVYNGAVLGEALRAGILALPSGQREAGLSIGFSPLATRLRIEFPQAFTQMLPIIIAQMVVLLKDTSLGYIVAYPELLSSIKNLSGFLGNAYLFTFWFVGIVLYLTINLTVSWIGRRVSRQLATKGR